LDDVRDTAGAVRPVRDGRVGHRHHRPGIGPVARLRLRGDGHQRGGADRDQQAERPERRRPRDHGPGRQFSGCALGRRRPPALAALVAPPGELGARLGLALGALPGPGGVRFRVWAAGCRTVEVEVAAPGPARRLPLAPGPDAVFEALVPDLGSGARYAYRPDGRSPRPDPVSRSQPDGVHGPSAVVDPGAFPWTDPGWRGVPRADLRLYELHVGTFTEAGTFDAAIPHLAELRDLGLTAIELMPVAEFPGGRNWGYDGVHLFAPQSTYGGPHRPPPA